MEKPKKLIQYRDRFLTHISRICDLLPKNSIFQENWDNLIILDACRYDFFKKAIKVSEIDGKLKKIFSVAPHTIPFCRKTFTKDKYDDIICISTNPAVDREVGHKFHDIIPVWKNNWTTIYGGTVLPSDVFPFVFRATIKYPHKRLLIWFVQPHSPYLYYKLNPMGVLSGRFSHNILKFYQAFLWANIPIKELRKRYMRNLLIVLANCSGLLKILHGKTVISSDHAECLGHRFPFTPFRIYGHYEDIQTPTMYKVPYFICD